MTTVVQKYGGSSLATVERVRSVARRIARTRRAGQCVVVVVSARGDTTDGLLELVAQVGRVPPAREVDQLLATGECASAALLAVALEDLGVRAVSLTGGQAGIRVSGRHGAGRVDAIEARRIRELLRSGAVVVVAGFQGVNAAGDLVTLGRGGSDLTAVAIAAELGVDVCEIRTDVAGVFTADPRAVPHARLLASLPAGVMAELAFAGAQVIHPRAIELADLRGVDIHVADALADAPGSFVTRTAEETLEGNRSVVAVAHDVDVAHALADIDGSPKRLVADVLAFFADQAVPIDLLAYSAWPGSRSHVGFTFPASELDRLEPFRGDLTASAGAFAFDPHAAKVSLVGTGLLNRPDSTAGMLAALHETGIETTWVAASQRRVSAVVPRARAADAAAVLHRHFGLDRLGPVDLDTSPGCGAG